ncbi:MAG: hypothetical protein O9350_19790 [Microcystis sp. LE19-388.1G]|nr:hypothetical protein [Microcystis sp. LE19-388.1G]
MAPQPPRHRGGWGVWGFTSFEVANYLIFREKVPKFPPDHSPIQYFLIDKRSHTKSCLKSIE